MTQFLCIFLINCSNFGEIGLTFEKIFRKCYVQKIWTQLKDRNKRSFVMSCETIFALLRLLEVNSENIGNERIINVENVYYWIILFNHWSEAEQKISSFYYLIRSLTFRKFTYILKCSFSVKTTLKIHTNEILWALRRD